VKTSFCSFQRITGGTNREVLWKGAGASPLEASLPTLAVAMPEVSLFMRIGRGKIRDACLPIPIANSKAA
jgi:hypothetical protein